MGSGPRLSPHGARLPLGSVGSRSNSRLGWRQSRCRVSISSSAARTPVVDVEPDSAGAVVDAPHGDPPVSSQVQAFLQKLTREVPSPLASPPSRITPFRGSERGPRRSMRLALQSSVLAVRPSKRGELLLMRRLGLVKEGQEVT